MNYGRGSAASVVLLIVIAVLTMLQMHFEKSEKNFSLESFKYYLDMPAYIYPQSERVVKYGFLTFVMNSVIVIGFAMIAQVILCSVCAFVISRQLSQRAGKFVLMFFLGG